jgi:hypothetical protein
MATGFSVGPTLTDFMNAAMYANDVITKEACEARPDIYTWVPSMTTRYPCPEGLTCSTGECKFKEEACRTMSTLPYHDCVRRTVPCDTHPTGLCNICDYRITAGRNIAGPYIDKSLGDVPEGCWAGDEKYEAYEPYPVPLLAPEMPDECTSDDQCLDGAVCVVGDQNLANFGTCVVPCGTLEDCTKFDAAALCGQAKDGALQGLCYVPNAPRETVACPRIARDFTPYLVTMYDQSEEAAAYAEANPDEPRPTIKAPVPCVTDEECVIAPGVGGACGRDPTKASYGFCFDPYTAPYLEWRDEIKLWDGIPPSRNVCVETTPYSRQWCEMPWTRPGANPNDPNIPLPQRVKNAWKNKARPPFWYDERDGTCHVTKTYCEANLKNGGFSAGYGRNLDYWLGSTCTGGTNYEVKGGYDCCTKLGDSIGEFFLGRTLTTSFRELVEGDTEGFGQLWGNYLNRGLEDGVILGNPLIGPYAQVLQKVDPGLANVIDFISDPRLKRNLRVLATHVFPNVHAYEWVWDPTATVLYGLTGTARGFLTPEVATIYPHVVQADAHGYEHLVVDRNTRMFRVLQQMGAVSLPFSEPSTPHPAQ